MGLLLTLSAAAACAPRPAVAAKIDILVLKNGDRITGEIKSLTRGKLEYKTDDAGRLQVEWEKIARLTSPHSFEAEDALGRRYVGRLSPSDRDGFVLFSTTTGTDTLAISHVTGMMPINAAFTQRLIAYLDVGFTLAKANQATTFTLGGKVTYRGPKLGAQFTYDSYAQGQETVQTTTRNTIRQSVDWYLRPRWSAVGIAQFEQNEELDLDHRVTAGGAVERMLQHSNQSELTLGLGLVGTQERFQSAGAITENTNLEGLVTANWEIYHFDSPSLDFSTTVALFPSLSQWGRLRGQGDFRVVYELFSDFNTGIKLTDTFDSEPPQGATKNDYVVEFTIGWSYRR